MKTGRILSKPWQAAISVMLALAVLSTMALVVSADTSDQTVALTEGTEQGGVLPGNEAGSYANYRIDYPGDKADLRIQMVVGLGDPVYAPMIGFHVYGPYGMSADGVAQDDGSLEVSYCEEEAAYLLVQVYNYSSVTMPYALSVEGLSSAVAEETLATTAVLPDPSNQPLENTVTDVVIGNGGGAFGKHLLGYAGDESDVTIEMTFSPADPSFAQAFGFEIWSPAGEHIATGIAPNSDSKGTLWATFASDVAGNYIVQVFNYANGVALNYTLTTAN